MNNSQTLKELIIKLILNIAPEAEMHNLDPSEDLREELDLDSMDFLNLLDSIAKETGVNVPESDYSRVNSLQSLTAYIEERC